MNHCQRKEATLLQACAVLFGPHLDISSSFLDYIQVSGVKSAYRNRAKETHPDLNHNSSALRTANQDWHMVRESYEQLCHYLSQRDRAPLRPLPASPARAGSTAASPHRRYSPGHGQEKASSLPTRKLLFGEFLVHSGICPWNEVFLALSWQRQSRPRLGEIACNFDWINKEDILTIFRHLRNGSRFGETAVRMGLLTSGQLERLLRHQTIRQKRIGQFFLHNNRLSPEQLQRTLWHFSKHNFLAGQQDKN